MADTHMSLPRAPGRRRQAGVALILVLLVVALATVAAVHMTRQGQLDSHRTGNRLALAQAHEIALGGEQWAIAVLARHRRAAEYAGVDARDQAWAQRLPPMPIEGGAVAGGIDDLQARLNINNLVTGERVDPVALARLQRLLRVLEIDPEVVAALVDWLDADSETTYPAGAEDDYYALLEPAYRAANRSVAVASELRLVRGIDTTAWRRLAPHVTALPVTIGINVNTATPAVLRAVVPGLSARAALLLHEQAGEEPFVELDDFLAHPLVRAAADESGRGVDDHGLGVGSRAFRVRTDVRLGAIEYTLYSWLVREHNGASRVLRRSRTAE